MISTCNLFRIFWINENESSLIFYIPFKWYGNLLPIQTDVCMVIGKQWVLFFREIEMRTTAQNEKIRHKIIMSCLTWNTSLGVS